MYKRQSPLTVVVSALLALIVSIGSLLLGAAITGIIVMFLWNWLIPVLFVGAVTSGTVIGTITWVQGWAISWMCALLFKSSCNCGSKD